MRARLNGELKTNELFVFGPKEDSRESSLEYLRIVAPQRYPPLDLPHQKLRLRPLDSEYTHLLYQKACLPLLRDESRHLLKTMIDLLPVPYLPQMPSAIHVETLSRDEVGVD